jgi:hypothetical protein
MKKVILGFIIINLYLIPNIFAQPSFFFFNKEINNWYFDVKQQEIIKEIQKVISSDEINSLLTKHQSKIDSIIPYFHLIDFNNDGLRDLIFKGKIGTKNYVLLFKKRIDATYNLLLNQAGEILQTNAPFQNNPLALTIWNNNCCGSKVSILTKWICIVNNDISFFQVQEKSLVYNNTLLPEIGAKKIPLQPFTIKTEVAKLRINPRMDDESVIEGLNAWKGNHISYHPKGAPGVIYHSLKDKDGINWYFVCIFTGKDFPTRSDRFMISGEIDDCENYSYYGWIHGDNLNIITQ